MRAIKLLALDSYCPVLARLRQSKASLPDRLAQIRVQSYLKSKASVTTYRYLTSFQPARCCWQETRACLSKDRVVHIRSSLLRDLNRAINIAVGLALGLPEIASSVATRPQVLCWVVSKPLPFFADRREAISLPSQLRLPLYPRIPGYTQQVRSRATAATSLSIKTRNT